METIAQTYPPSEQTAPLPLSASPRNAQIHVLLIEDNLEQADLVQITLAEAGDQFQVEWVPNLVAAINRLAQPGIDVTVLDLGMPELLGPKSHRAIRLTAPEIPVVILTADDHVDSKDLTLAAGAEEYLVKGRSSPDELKQAIRRAFYRKQFRSKLLNRKPSSSPPGFAVAFLGAKGGVGTTSSLLNVTEALSAQHSAIAFETAAQGGFAFQMDALRSVDGGRSAPLKLDREWLSRSVEPTSNGAGVLFSPLLPWRGTEAANGIAKQILRLSKTVADFVMIDAGCHLDGLTAALVSECQAVTIVVDCEPASTAAARETLRLLQPLSRPGCEVSILAVNRSGVAKPPAAEQLQEYFGRRVLGVVPYSGGPTDWMRDRQAPFAVTDPEGASTSSFLEIAWRLTEDAAARRAK